MPSSLAALTGRARKRRSKCRREWEKVPPYSPIAAERVRGYFSHVRQILNDIEAGKVTDELQRRGIPLRQRLRVVVESIEAEEPSLTAMNAAGAGCDAVISDRSCMKPFTAPWRSFPER